MSTVIDPHAGTFDRLAPPRESTSSEAGADVEENAHGWARRLAERFALIAFALYHVPLFLNNYPSLGGGGMSDRGLAIRWGHVFTPAGVWVARHILLLTGPMPGAYQGDNGDVGEEFGRLLLAVVIGAVAALCWIWADRQRPRGRWVGDALRILLRFSIALGIASYAISKILPVQFPPLSGFTLEQRIGDLSPMALLWTFMEYSRPYNFFAGAMELLVVVLLCFRRTTTLGALLCIAVMANVALLNYAYGVPVKLYSTMTVLSAVVLVSYDAPRLWALFVKNERVAPADLRIRFLERIPMWLQWTIEGVVVGSVMLSSVAAMSGLPTQIGSSASGVEGAWSVTDFRLGDRQAPGTTLARWRRLVVQGHTAAIRFDTDSLVYCGLSGAATSSGALTLRCPNRVDGELHWSRAGDALQLAGTFAGYPVTANARLLKPSDYRLLSTHFRWIMDR